MLNGGRQERTACVTQTTTLIEAFVRKLVSMLVLLTGKEAGSHRVTGGYALIEDRAYVLTKAVVEEAKRVFERGRGLPPDMVKKLLSGMEERLSHETAERNGAPTIGYALMRELQKLETVFDAAVASRDVAAVAVAASVAADRKRPTPRTDAGKQPTKKGKPTLTPKRKGGEEAEKQVEKQYRRMAGGNPENPVKCTRPVALCGAETLCKFSHEGKH